MTARQFVYFIQSGDAVKIGISNDPKRRMVDLAYYNPVALELLGVLDGDVALERYLHDKFDKHRIRGEWFKLAPEILEYIRQNAASEEIRTSDSATPTEVVALEGSWTRGQFCARHNITRSYQEKLRTLGLWPQESNSVGFPCLITAQAERGWLKMMKDLHQGESERHAAAYLRKQARIAERDLLARKKARGPYNSIGKVRFLRHMHVKAVEDATA
jgi:hypothetical protein